MIERSWFDIIWNPKKRIQKFFFDCVASIKTTYNTVRNTEDDTSRDIRDATIKLSDGYIGMLNYILHLPLKDETIIARQFIVAEATQASGERVVIPVCRSDFHPVK